MLLKPVLVGIGGGIISRIADSFRQKNIDFEGISSRKQDKYWLLDLTNPSEFDYDLITDDHLIVLAAAISSPDKCQKEYTLARQVNVEGTVEFAQRCLDRGARVLFFSSDTVYGPSQPGEAPFIEDVTLQPLGEYAQMKAEAEALLLPLGEVKVIRLSYVFWRDDKFTKYLTQCALTNQAAEIFDPFDRCIVYIEDVKAAVERYCDAWSDIYDKVINVGSSIPVSRWQFATMFKNLVYPNLMLTKVEPKEDFFRARPRLISMDTQRLTRLLGRQPTTVEQAIAREFSGEDQV
ncbi:MAG: NAD-dependent epimerase/dehydratase family protein [Gloeocapsa sp. DLM2.Bin57]|nr:MAG: NAD-dependent epimerase/dehydratase family protein [Gloeocapsa sp. DLM2.Bin57]